ncbi:hypothetical protein F2P81_002211 [Scophthalmus maximus]|uniref:Uncharacterized protein n=1 Tax=Scophthalmus maximus TaxID=52904 RepID=A0A6A4TUK3_SCOMX|nr:hypothetical protein F2P81_002211 [Scophthalmus maximus]
MRFSGTANTAGPHLVCREEKKERKKVHLRSSVKQRSTTAKWVRADGLVLRIIRTPCSPSLASPKMCCSNVFVGTEECVQLPPADSIGTIRRGLTEKGGHQSKSMWNGWHSMIYSSLP